MCEITVVQNEANSAATDGNLNNNFSFGFLFAGPFLIGAYSLFSFTGAPSPSAKPLAAAFFGVRAQKGKEMFFASYLDFLWILFECE